MRSQIKSKITADKWDSIDLSNLYPNGTNTNARNLYCVLIAFLYAIPFTILNINGFLSLESSILFLISVTVGGGIVTSYFYFYDPPKELKSALPTPTNGFILFIVRLMVYTLMTVVATYSCYLLFLEIFDTSLNIFIVDYFHFMFCSLIFYSGLIQLKNTPRSQLEKYITTQTNLEEKSFDYNNIELNEFGEIKEK